ncbi:MAG TPA: cytochrome P450 [Pseudonocardiaceae bacterium]|nr:cytochrome P450 [Pseudonocardiaceae bacterium]
MTAEHSTREALAPGAEDGGATLLPWLREMRDNQPVWRDAYGIWHLFRYADVHRTISDPVVFSSDTGRVFPAAQKFSAGNLVRTDPPRHHQLRRLVGAAFSPKVVTGLAPRIAEITRELLDATGGAREFDLVAALAYPLPVTVIAELLGLPVSDRELFRSWADRLFNQQVSDPRDPELAQKIENNTKDMLAYLREHCQDRRANPRQDLISGLVGVRVDGERLTDDEVTNFSMVLLLAGHITTTALLGNTALCLDEHPEVLAELHADPALIPAAIEEVLRYRSSFTQVARVTMIEAEVAGQVIPADALVTPWLLSANRDEREFPDPDRFDIHRAANHHVAFGHGIHFCIGQLLARVEGRVAVGVLLERYADVRLNADVPLAFYGRGIFAARNVPIVVRPA